MLFDIVYSYFYDLFNSQYINGYSTSIMGVNTNMAQWLAITLTIIIMILLVVIMALIVRWVFRVCAGLVRAF